MNTFGPYQLIEEIGAGGMAEVWLGREEKSGTLYAIKRIHPHLAKEKKFIEMFLDEAKIGQCFDHPNIAKIVDVGAIDGIPYITMEFIEGKDLAYVLDTIEHSGYEIPIGVALAITIQILEALGYAHRYKIDGVDQNIIHRDISPHNMLVSKTGRVCLLDFGVAKALDRSAKTETGVVKGKLSYMSPEQVTQEAMDHRADLFSMGVVLYELLTQSTPFGRELKAVNGIINNEAPDPKLKRPEVPAELSAFVSKALLKDPKLRFQSAFEMASELREIQAQHYPTVDRSKIEHMFSTVRGFHRETTKEQVVDASPEVVEEIQPKQPEPEPTPEVPTKSKKKKRSFLFPVALFLLIIFLGVASYQTLFSKTKTVAKKPEVSIRKEITKKVETALEAKIEIPLFTKLLSSLSLKKSELPELTETEMKHILKYRFERLPEDYLINEKVNRVTNVFAEKTTEEAEAEPTFVDPGDPKARFNLRTTLKERKKRRRERKELRKVRRDFLEKKRLAEKKNKKRKQKRKRKFINKVIPAGF